MKSSFIRILSDSILFVFFSLAITACHRSDQSVLSPTTQSIISTFYSENKEQKVLEMINQLDVQKLSTEDQYICTLYKAAALCELDQKDSARQTISRLRISTDHALNYWYESVSGLLEFRQGNTNKAYELLLETTYHADHDARAQALNERLLARMALNLDEYEKGLDWLLKSTAHYTEAGLTKSTGINYKLLGRHYIAVRNYDEAYKNFILAEKILLPSKDSRELFYLYVNLVDFYLQTNELKKAKFYAEHYLNKYVDWHDNQMQTLVYDNKGEIEFRLGNYPMAEHYFAQTLNIPADYPAGTVRNIHAMINMAAIYRIYKKYQQAEAYIKTARSYTHFNIPHYLQQRIYKEASAIYQAQKNYPVAYLYLDSANMQMDSINLSESHATKAFYDSRAKLTNMVKHLNETHQRERLLRIIHIAIFSVLIILLVAAATIVSIQRAKTKVLQSLAEKNLQLLEDERKLNEKKFAELTTRKSRRKSDHEKWIGLYQNVLDWLEKDNQFTRSDLSVELMAKELNTNREYISRALSEHDVRFNDLINKYRIQLVIQILSDKSNIASKYRLSVIAKTAGYNSDSVFIDAFKKQTGMTPTQFRDNIKPQTTI